jgi:hypothetical protein
MNTDLWHQSQTKKYKITMNDVSKADELSITKLLFIILINCCLRNSFTQIQ